MAVTRCTYCGAPLVEGVQCECVIVIIAQRDLYYTALHRITDAPQGLPAYYFKAVAAEALAHADVASDVVPCESEGDSGDLLGSLRGTVSQPHTGEKA